MIMHERTLVIARAFRRSHLLPALLMAVLATPAVPAAHVAATTTISVEGTVVTLRVPLQIRLPPDFDPTVVSMETGERTPLGQYYEDGAEKLWNDGLAGLRHGDCLTFRIDVEIDLLEPGVPASGDHYMEIDNDPEGVPMFWDPATNDPQVDTTSAYTEGLIGNLPPIDDGVFAHELGHLLGLGDDYGTTEFPPGRGPGLMDGTHDITQNYVDRIAKLLEDLDKLPECWSGKMQSETTRDYKGLGRCSDTWETELRMTVALDGKVTGDGTARLVNGPTCTFPFPAITELPPLALQTMTVAGTSDEGALLLRLTPAPLDATGTHGVVTGFAAIYTEIYGGAPLEVPKGTPCRAIGHPETRSSALDYGGDLHIARNSIELTCSELAFR